MNFVADEGVEREIVDSLRQLGHTVLYVAEMSPGISDDEVLEQANHASAIVITTDKVFGELIFRQKRIHHGVILSTVGLNRCRSKGADSRRGCIGLWGSAA